MPLRVQREPGGPLEECFLDFVYQPIRDQYGKVTGIFLEGSDVTVRKRIEDELREANRQKDDFLAMLAHELRNPLAPITTAAQLLQRGEMDTPGIARASAIIARQAGHMTALVNDLLDVSRVTRGQVTMAQEAVAVEPLVQEAVEQVRPMIDSCHHELFVDVAPGLYVLGDRTRLIQVLSNILNNAAKYTPARGRIVLSVRMEGGDVRIAVRDNGQGIEPPMLPYIFDLFTQAERTPDRSQGGLGLGLALVKSLVQLHGGRVDALSDGLDEGSEFVVYLPLLEPAAPVAAAGAGRARDGSVGLARAGGRRQRRCRRDAGHAAGNEWVCRSGRIRRRQCTGCGVARAANRGAARYRLARYGWPRTGAQAARAARDGRGGTGGADRVRAGRGPAACT